MKFLLKILLLSVLLLTSINIFAQDEKKEPEETLKVIGLFDGAALVDYAGKQKLYRSGQQINKDIKLIKASSRIATFLVKGKKLELGIGSSQGYSSYREEKPESKKETIDEKKTGLKTAKIILDNHGRYLTLGFINGRPVKFLVDTGATSIAMSEKTAKSLNLDYRRGQKGLASTANGTVAMWSIILQKVKVGDIELRNISAGVIKGVGTNDILLGMSFLSQLKMENDGAILTLTKKY